jgi:TnpA family transposase
MPTFNETAYPRLKSSVSRQELVDSYTPTEAEVELASRISKGAPARFAFLVQLKTFQRLGYFIALRDVPRSIVEYIGHDQGMLIVPDTLAEYDESGTRRRHVPIIRKYLHVKNFDEDGRALLSSTVQLAAARMEDLADIVNVAIEELIRHSFELPGFTSLIKEAQRGRAEVNRVLYRRVYDAMTADGRNAIDTLLAESSSESRKTRWNTLKQDAQSPTLTHLRELLERQRWLDCERLPIALNTLLPEVKLRQFALEAKSLDAARMQEMAPEKRYTLAATLIELQNARALDDLAEMFIKRLMRIHRHGREALALDRLKHQERTDTLIHKLHEVIVAWGTEGNAEERLQAIGTVLTPNSHALLEQCEAHQAQVGNNYYSYLWRFYQSHRSTLIRIWRALKFRSTTQETSLGRALDLVLENETSRAEWLSLPGQWSDLDWVPDTWWRLVTGAAKREPVGRVDRRFFELCVFTQMMWDLKSGDAAIEGSREYAHYREQLISEEEAAEMTAAYQQEAGIPTDAKEFVSERRQWLTSIAQETDRLFPDNEALRIENGEPILTKLVRKKTPERLAWLEATIKVEMEQTPILDALADTENLLHWTRFFGPLSGLETKLDHPRERYLLASFCYGCNLGPSQTARSVQGTDRRQIAWINQRHITEDALDEAITTVINAYNNFALPRLWGSGKHASADGTRWDLYEQNLLSEYHIRYGGYGGIGYYHVSETYIALFSHFIPCGVWEAVYILDGLLKNKSDVQPDVLHADTQGQSEPVFALSNLLGIELMPRIRDWKNIDLCRPDRNAHYEHIDSLFSENINWSLIETHFPDMLRVVLSIKAGRISASTILRRLGTYSRKNRLYQAFCELGRAIRTGFLLRYISNQELRSVIQGATNKSEALNCFLQWTFFGGEGVITENSRDEQRKAIKYNHLVANCLIFQFLPPKRGGHDSGSDPSKAHPRCAGTSTRDGGSIETRVHKIRFASGRRTLPTQVRHRARSRGGQCHYRQLQRLQRRAYDE